MLPRLTDIAEAITRVQTLTDAMSLADFTSDWQSQWLVERGVEIISEASRHLSDDLKARHPQIPWRKVAGIGNILRHDYGSVAGPVMWKLAREDLPELAKVCAKELEGLR